MIIPTIGLDAEMFLMRPTTMEYIPSCGLIGGTKKNPLPMANLPTGFAVQEDNVTLEFNIPPASTEDDWFNNIDRALLYINNLLKTHSQGPFRRVLQGSAKFDTRLLYEHPAAMTMGCDPDKNAYTGKFNRPPNVYEMNDYRTAGAHIHVGYPNPSIIMNRKIVIAMDIVLGKRFKEEFKDPVRDSFYGKLGSYRDKPYGVEYRTLCPSWLKSSNTIRDAYKKTIQAYDLAKSLPLRTLVNLASI